MRTLIVLLICFTASQLRAQPTDILFADFEAETYGDWTATGDAFGAGPATGTLPRQMEVSGFAGKRLINSFHGGDGSTGTLTSPPFEITRKQINFLIGGGGFAAKTCMNLVVDGKPARTATGPNTQPGGRELLEPQSWDVAELAGKNARIEIIDNATGGWGHILVDQIVFSDKRLAAMRANARREIVAERQLLNLPIRNDAPIRNAKLIVDGNAVREFTIGCADAAPDWWATLDISAYRGKSLTIEVDRLPDDSTFLTTIDQTDAPKQADTFYREALRPQFHFSPSRGWNNDPNGLVYFNGEYHLFFQLNPYGTKWGNMHWGHAVSKDLIRWQELPIALHPDEFGPMFSGSAVVDWTNSSGLGSEGKPPLVLVYTAAGKSVQCLASSTDGRTFAKYPQNPVVKTISGGNRDPKVFWHEPTKRWVMVLYAGFPVPAKDAKSKPSERHTIQILTSPNLIEWTPTSEIEGFYECPDLFPLTIDGDAKEIRWVLTAASSEYMIGRFDGKVFTPETPKLKGHMGKGFYAAQTFSDIPASDGRRIMIGWLQTPSPGMPFNQSMSVPLELKLLTTPEGPRLSFMPVKELESLRDATKRIGPIDLNPGDDPLADLKGDLLDIRLQFEPAEASDLELMVHGASIRFDAKERQWVVNGHKAPAPARDGKQRLTVLADRNSLEIFTDDGLTYIPLPFIPKDADQTVRIVAKGGTAKVDFVEVHTLKSSW
ncbi:MAG: sacC [Phycisphaerales bacterium]|nr:sacC [Phycisphaerales bacterium]